jgi:drug/metabolite transporter (DMT)-like permease
MKSDIVFAFAAMVCYGVGDFIYKRAAATGVAAEQFLMGQRWVFCPATIRYAWIAERLHFTPSVELGGLVGRFLLIGFFNYVGSLRSGSVSVVARYSGSTSSSPRRWRSAGWASRSPGRSSPVSRWL